MAGLGVALGPACVSTVTVRQKKTRRQDPRRPWRRSDVQSACRNCTNIRAIARGRRQRSPGVKMDVAIVSTMSHGAESVRFVSTTIDSPSSGNSWIEFVKPRVSP